MTTPTPKLYLNGAVFDGLTADFSEYTDVKVGGIPLAKKNYVDAASAAVPAGPTGATGLQGPAGAAGTNGAVGPAGATGATGLQGPAGAAGPAGTNGTNGTDILGLDNTFIGKNTFNKQLVLPQELTPVTVSVSGTELTIDCDNASSGIFNLTINSSATISKLIITNALPGGQYVVYINNTTPHTLTINGRQSPLYVDVNSINNVGKLNYPVAIRVQQGTEFSNAILSFTYDGTNAYVACSAYGSI